MNLDENKCKLQKDLNKQFPNIRNGGDVILKMEKCFKEIQMKRLDGR